MKNPENQTNPDNLSESDYLEELFEGKVNLNQNSKKEEIFKYLKVN